MFFGSLLLTFNMDTIKYSRFYSYRHRTSNVEQGATTTTTTARDHATVPEKVLLFSRMDLFQYYFK